MKDWSHPRLVGVECSLNDTDAIAAEARAAFERRRDTYPQLVKSGKIKADEARDDIEGWRAIAKDWRWVALGEGSPATADTLGLRIAALDTALARWFERIDQISGGANEESLRQCALLCAMRIWAEREKPGRNPFNHIRTAARWMHDWRHDSGHPPRGAILAARQSKTERTAA